MVGTFRRKERWSFVQGLTGPWSHRHSQDFQGLRSVTWKTNIVKVFFMDSGLFQNQNPIYPKESKANSHQIHQVFLHFKVLSPQDCMGWFIFSDSCDLCSGETTYRIRPNLLLLIASFSWLLAIFKSWNVTLHAIAIFLYILQSPTHCSCHFHIFHHWLMWYGNPTDFSKVTPGDPNVPLLVEPKEFLDIPVLPQGFKRLNAY